MFRWYQRSRCTRPCTITVKLNAQSSNLSNSEQVCRHHASRGLAVLLRHGLGGKGGKSSPPYPANGATALMGKLTTGASSLSSGRKYGDNDNTDGSIQHGMAMKNAGGISGGHSRVMFDDEQRQPWRVIQTWLELRHDLAAVALLQVFLI